MSRLNVGFFGAKDKIKIWVDPDHFEDFERPVARVLVFVLYVGRDCHCFVFWSLGTY